MQQQTRIWCLSESLETKMQNYGNANSGLTNNDYGLNFTILVLSYWLMSRRHYPGPRPWSIIAWLRWKLFKIMKTLYVKKNQRTHSALNEVVHKWDWAKLSAPSFLSPPNHVNLKFLLFQKALIWFLSQKNKGTCFDPRHAKRYPFQFPQVHWNSSMVLHCDVNRSLVNNG